MDFSINQNEENYMEFTKHIKDLPQNIILCLDEELRDLREFLIYPKPEMSVKCYCDIVRTLFIYLNQDIDLEWRYASFVQHVMDNHTSHEISNNEKHRVHYHRALQKAFSTTRNRFVQEHLYINGIFPYMYKHAMNITDFYLSLGELKPMYRSLNRNLNSTPLPFTFKK